MAGDGWQAATLQSSRTVSHVMGKCHAQDSRLPFKRNGSFLSCVKADWVMAGFYAGSPLHRLLDADMIKQSKALLNAFAKPRSLHLAMRMLALPRCHLLALFATSNANTQTVSSDYSKDLLSHSIRTSDSVYCLRFTSISGHCRPVKIRAQSED